MSKELPIISTKSPIKIEVEAGKKYFWCSCGASNNQPFCDGAHKEYKDKEGKSLMKSIAYEANESKVVYFCGCKHSKNGALCDGSHSLL